MSKITRDNVDEILDSGRLYCEVRPNRWLRISRRGKTVTSKTEPNAVRIPFTTGRTSGQITEIDFIDGVLNPTQFRLKED